MVHRKLQTWLLAGASHNVASSRPELIAEEADTCCSVRLLDAVANTGACPISCCPAAQGIAEETTVRLHSAEQTSAFALVIVDTAFNGSRCFACPVVSSQGCASSS